MSMIDEGYELDEDEEAVDNPEVEVPASISSRPSAAAIIRIVCHDCEKIFQSDSEFKGHISRCKHLDDKSQRPSGATISNNITIISKSNNTRKFHIWNCPFACGFSVRKFSRTAKQQNIFSDSFRLKHVLKEHKVQIYKKYNGETGQSLKQIENRALKDQYRALKDKLQIWRCNEEVCNKSFRTEQELKAHSISAHSRLKAFKCDTCNFIGEQLSALYQHRKHVHGLDSILHYTSLEQVYCKSKSNNPDQVNAAKIVDKRSHNDHFPSEVRLERLEHDISQKLTDLRQQRQMKETQDAILSTVQYQKETVRDEKINRNQSNGNTSDFVGGIDDNNRNVIPNVATMSAQDRLHRLEHDISKKLNDIRKQRKEETVNSKTHYPVVMASKNERPTKQIQQNYGEVNGISKLRKLKLRKLKPIEIEKLKLRKLKPRAKTRQINVHHQESYNVAPTLTVVSIPFPKKASS